MSLPKINYKATLLLFILALINIGFFLKPSVTESANLTQVKDTLQTSRLSFAGRVKSPTAAGSSHVWLYTTGTDEFYSISTVNLHAGDSLTIGSGTYTIVDIIDTDEFTVTPVLASGDADDTDPIYYKSKAQHVITFNTASAIANGYFTVLIPANTTTSTSNNGSPDDSGFDFNDTDYPTDPDITVTANNVTGYTFVTGVATPSSEASCNSLYSTGSYHCFEVHYSGSGAVGTGITITIGSTGGTTTPILPSPNSSHNVGTADSYTFQLRHYDGSNNLIDQTNGKIALIEAVRVTATVDPTITFTIAGVTADTGTYCGVTRTAASVDSTAYSVPFGSLSLNTFADAVQNLTVSTNANYGYVVTAAEDDELGKDGATTPFIADTTCNSGPCTISAEQEWTTATNNGFGYSLQNVDAASISFEYNTGAGTFKARPFANLADTETPQTLFSSSAVADSQNAYVCYRLSVGATQAAGDYENVIIYRATASF